MNKTCKTCGIEKDIKDFTKNCQSKDGYRNQCKICYNKYMKVVRNKPHVKKWIEDYKNNPEIKLDRKIKRDKYLTTDHAKKLRKNYAETHKEESSIRRKQYEKKNRNKIRARKRVYVRNRLRSDPVYKLHFGIRRSITGSLKKGQKNGRSWESLVGYTLNDLKLHLESKFEEGMSWDNHGFYGWHIDHKRPISSFDITSAECEDFKECWSLENLQPLWWYENLKKSNKLF